MFGALHARQAVQASPDPLQLARSGQARQHDPRGPDAVQIARAQQTFLPGQAEHALVVGVDPHGVSMFLLFVDFNYLTNKRNIRGSAAVVRVTGQGGPQCRVTPA